MRAFKILLITGLVILLSAILGVGYFFLIQPKTLPVYRLGRLTEANSNFVATTLSLNGQSYISGEAEFSLDMTADHLGWNQRIGKSEDGMDIYAIPGQDTGNYIALTTEMFPYVVFRNRQLPPVELATLKVDEIQMLGHRGNKQLLVSTKEKAILDEVMASLQRKEGVIQGNPTERTGDVHLISDALPGLGYYIHAFTDEEGRVYLALRNKPEEWIPAGAAFTKWFQDTMEKIGG